MRVLVDFGALTAADWSWGVVESLLKELSSHDRRVSPQSVQACKDQVAGKKHLAFFLSSLLKTRRRCQGSAVVNTTRALCGVVDRVSHHHHHQQAPGCRRPGLGRGLSEMD
ncbi:hypothetical protein B0T18DRAFT_402714 [Schizothecium vesticola]|uniref:Uncharacterized protein n=1 Tax=Schizothecium vesticola TaxID=314040 RepID=A0AA40F5B5_9PEZI|nr:hypothetical protein B0T18DRAFT_402714 [Schizothecium vesticola]